VRSMIRLAVPSPRRQKGWVGLIVLLLAVVIVALLAKTALKQYRLLDGGVARSPAASSASAAAAGLAIDGSVGAAVSAPATPLDQARNMGATVQQQADDLARRMNEAER
jgi:hypothetical protein